MIDASSFYCEIPCFRIERRTDSRTFRVCADSKDRKRERVEATIAQLFLLFLHLEKEKKQEGNIATTKSTQL